MKDSAIIFVAVVDPPLLSIVNNKVCTRNIVSGPLRSDGLNEK